MYPLLVAERLLELASEALDAWQARRALFRRIQVGDCRLEECDEVIAFSDGGLVAALGVSGLVIVRAGDATLVAARDRLDDIRSFVRRMTGGNGA